ncbi:cellulase family glycosylhydrolase [Dactylosporangium cerinum]|uniref:cellulase n=1 Tax=Dactylosporangium cerinum TaxID=1434730 RepID=A0ABV9VPF3_9ACTN
MRFRLHRKLLAAAAAVLLVPLAPFVSSAPAAAADPTDWLHTAGNKIVDSQGNEVWLTGTNWFGFNATERVFHGLWSGNITEITKSMADRGINIVRVPISTQLLLEWKAGQAAVPSGVNTFANPELVGKTTLQVFDYFLQLCQQFGIKVMLDVHSAEADNSGHIYPVWWKGSITPELFYQAWEWVIDRYKTNDTLVAADIKNEPHGKWSESPRAKWDNSTDQDNFKNTCQVAGNRILAKNPNMLILCEGIEIFPKNGTNWSSTAEADYYGNWWGGNLRGVKNYPVNLGNHIVYSPHDYGPLVYEQPWFQKPFDKASLTTDVWQPNWLYIHTENTAPLLVGEWGGRLGQDARQDKWMYALRDTIIEKRISQTFWVLNPNSGDTGGLLLDDWKTWDEAKYAMLKPALWSYQNKFVGLDHTVKLGTNGLSLNDRYGGTSDTVAPSVPAGLTVAGTTGTSVSLTWTASTDNSGTVAGYDIYRGATKVGTSATPSFTDTGLAQSTTYSYTVRAFDAAGNVSAASAARTATTTSTPVDTTPPSVPAGLAVAGTTTSSVSLSWAASTDNSGSVAGYDVYRGTTKVGSPSGTSYVDTGLAANTTYSYTVRARDAAGNVSAASAAVSGTTAANPTGVVRVQYRNNSVPTNDQEIKPGLQVVNGGTTALALNTVAVRYYFTRDGGSYAIWCDWAVVGCGNLTTRVVNLPSAVNGADAYIEVTFTGGTVAPGGNTGEIQLRVSRTDWQPVNEANDYSRGTGTSFADAATVPAFIGGSLAWGVVPA